MASSSTSVVAVSHCNVVVSSDSLSVDMHEMVNNLVYTKVLTRVQLTSSRKRSSNPPFNMG